MNVLIAYDGSSCATSAIEELCRAGLPTGVDALVISAIEQNDEPEALAPDDFLPSPAPPVAVMTRPVRPSLSRAQLTQAREIAAYGADLVQRYCPTWHVRSGIDVESAGQAIVRQARRWPADLVVVGSHGHSPLAGLLLGSVSQQVLAGSPCAVRVGRCRRQAGRQLANPVSEAPRVLVAIDGSPGAAAAVDAVCRRDWPAGTAFRVVTAVNLRKLATMLTFGVQLETGDAVYDGTDVYRGWVESAAKRLRGHGLTAEAAVIEGEAAPALLRDATRWHAECIFVGAKGHNRLAQVLLGSVSTALAERAPCAVEVVRPAEDSSHN
jgi:nucleotide-binding universal stress UspA family protein